MRSLGQIACAINGFYVGYTEQSDFLLYISAFVLGFVFLIAKTISGLGKRKYWAWITSIVIIGMLVPTFVFPFGIWGLYDLLKKETRNKFSSLDLGIVET